MKNILVLEDNEHLRTIIEDALSPDYGVKTAVTLKAAFNHIDNAKFDLIVADRLLPDGDSLDFIGFVHEMQFQTRILAISQMYQPAEKIKGLEQGADDYLAKPFSIGELKLKIKKMLSYDKRKDNSVYILKDLQFTPEFGEVHFHNRKTTLRKKEAAILECLFKYKNQVVSRKRLIDEVWNGLDLIPTQTTLDVYIRRIRILLGEYGSCIVTKRGFGYLLSDV